MSRDFSHLYPNDKEWPVAFFEQLIKTIAHTESIIAGIKDKDSIDYLRVMRTVNPKYERARFYRYDVPNFHGPVTAQIGFNYNVILDEVLAQRKIASLPLSNAHLLGQVLEFDIDITTHDGAPCVESKGFVDESDIPPIDTWFYISRSYLYCWIPNLFIDVMQQAIDVEILESYRWVKDVNPELQQKIDNILAAFSA